MPCYKILPKDLKTRGFQYDENVVAKMEGRPEVGKRGFHFCRNLFDCLKWNVSYRMDDNKHVVYEVEPMGEVVVRPDGRNCATNQLRLVRRIPVEEVRQMLTGWHIFNKNDARNKWEPHVIHIFYRDGIRADPSHTEAGLQVYDGHGRLINEEFVWNKTLKVYKYVSPTSKALSSVTTIVRSNGGLKNGLMLKNGEYRPYRTVKEVHNGGYLITEEWVDECGNKCVKRFSFKQLDGKLIWMGVQGLAPHAGIPSSDPDGEGEYVIRWVLYNRRSEADGPEAVIKTRKSGAVVVENLVDKVTFEMFNTIGDGNILRTKTHEIVEKRNVLDVFGTLPSRLFQSVEIGSQHPDRWDPLTRLSKLPWRDLIIRPLATTDLPESVRQVLNNGDSAQLDQPNEPDKPYIYPICKKDASGARTTIGELNSKTFQVRYFEKALSTEMDVIPTEWM